MTILDNAALDAMYARLVALSGTAAPVSRGETATDRIYAKLVEISGTAAPTTEGLTVADRIYRKLTQISGTASSTSGTELDLIYKKLAEIYGAAPTPHGETALDRVAKRIPRLPLLILDMDIDVDCDDVEALAIAAGLARQGECTITAATIISDNDYAAPCARVLLDYSGFSSVPIGAYKGSALPSGGPSLYDQACAENFGRTGDTRANYPNAVTVLRQTLAAAPNASTIISTKGALTNISVLLQSSADGDSALNGNDLVAAKVQGIHIMAGAFPSGNQEFNANEDIVAARYVGEHSPVPLYWTGFEVGNTVLTQIKTSVSVTNPYAYCWSLSGPQLVNNTRQAWDVVAMLNVLRGTAGVYSYSSLGDVSFDGSGFTTYSANPSGKSRYVIKTATDAAIAVVLQGLIDTCILAP